MKIILFFAIFSLLAVFKGDSATFEVCAGNQNLPDPESKCCGIQTYDKIIAGKYSHIDQYPWLALIEYDTTNGTKFLCGGSLISSRYVLTAAHCVTGPALEVATPKNIRLGEYDISNDGLDCEETAGGGKDCADPVIIIPIEELTPHPNYDHKHRKNDIALIRLKTPAPRTDFIQPICLPTADFTLNPPNYIPLWIAGWGTPSKNNARSNIKQQGSMPYVSKKVCQPIYNVKGRQVELWEKQLCAGGKKDKDSCYGDSGGPLMLEKPTYSELVGILSFGNYPCGAEDVPAVYTKVFEYKDWIQKTIKA